MYLDLDKFKPINDTLGHHAGDIVLKEVAQRLVNSVRTLDTVARLGGDEFAVIVHNTEDGDGVKIMAQRIINNITRPIMLKDGELTIGISIGITTISESDISVDNIITRADSAMYASKENGGNIYLFA